MAYGGMNTEYKPLKAVLLCPPHPSIDEIENPEGVLHVRRMNYKLAKQQYMKTIEMYEKHNVKVCFIDVDQRKIKDGRFLFNLMFTRDQFFMTPRGAIMSRMFSPVRRGEVVHARKAIEGLGIGVRKVVHAPGTFEGADALWVTQRFVIIGVGKRTNREGARQVREELKKDGITCMDLPAPEASVHLLGCVQLIDEFLAVLRIDNIPAEIVDVLKEHRIKIIGVNDNIELTEKHAMNFVTIAPHKIIMPADCPKTKRMLHALGIKIAGEVGIAQLINGGGGLACATGILSRED